MYCINKSHAIKKWYQPLLWIIKESISIGRSVWFLQESREFFPTKQRDLSNVNITTDYYKIKSGTNRKQLYLNFKNKVVINITSESEFFFTILDPTHQPKSSNRKNSKPTDKRQNCSIKLLPYECTKWDRN